MENNNGSVHNVEVKVDDKEVKKSNKLSQYEKTETLKLTKPKETTPKNKQKDQDNSVGFPILSLSTDTNLNTIEKKDCESEQPSTNATNTNEQQSQSVEQIPINYVSIVNSMGLDDIFINLNLISKIEAGDKLYIHDKYINIDTSYVQPILRWFYGVDRKLTINFVRLVINKSFEFCDVLVKSDVKMLFRLTNDLRNSISGLTKLKQTYAVDKLVQAEIDVIIEDIRAKIESTLITNN